MIRLRRVGLAAAACFILAFLVFAGPEPGTESHKPPRTARPRRRSCSPPTACGPTWSSATPTAGIMPTFKDLMRNGRGAARTACSRASRRTPASAGTRSRPARGRPSTARRTTHSTVPARDFNNHDELRDPGHPPGRHNPAGCRARRQEGRRHGVGGARGLVPALQGPVVDFRTFIGGRGIVLNFDLPGQPARANSFGVAVPAPDARGRDGLDQRAGLVQPRQGATFTHANTQIPGGGVWNVYIYDSTNNGAVNYDRVLIVNSAAAKDGSKSVANLARGDWADAKLTLASGSLAGKTAGFHAKLIDLNADASRFRLYFTSVQRVNATYNALGPAGSDAFAETLAHDFPTSTAADFAPLEALIVDEDTYVEQGLKWADAHFAYLRYIVNTLGYRPDVRLRREPRDRRVQPPVPRPADADRHGRPEEPVLRRRQRRRRRDHRLDEREGYIRAAYHEADETLALARSLMGEKDTTVFASSDHGFAPQWLRSTPGKILFETTVRNTVTGLDVSVHPSGDPALAGSLEQLPRRAGRRPGQSVLGRRHRPDLRQPDVADGHHLRGVRTARSAEFQGLVDPDVPGRQVILKVMKKEELRNVDGTDALHPNRSGDVVVVSAGRRTSSTRRRPARRSRSRSSSASTATCPISSTSSATSTCTATFVAAGPGHPRPLRRPRRAGDRRGADARLPARDPGPAERPRQDPLHILEDGGDLRELTILNISDWHAQLIPLTRRPTRRPTTAPAPPSRSAGSAFLKPWFDTYRDEARDGVAHGDRRRLVRRRDPADLERSSATSRRRDHEHDGLRRRGGRQPQLRPRRGVPAQRADPAGGLPDLLGEHRRSANGNDAAPSGRRRRCSTSAA